MFEGITAYRDLIKSAMEEALGPRYSFGGDEHVFVEFDEAMSLEACFKALSLGEAVRRAEIPGMLEICPANASALFRFNPDVVLPHEIMARIQALEEQVEHAEHRLDTRIIEIPVFYNDPWTHECLMRFRDRHQDPSSTDLEYSARINNFDSVAQLIEAHVGSPWFVSMVGFIAGDPWLFQMVAQDRQIQNPKYLQPRLDSPAGCVVAGGCFTGIMPVRSPGGYQMYGITPLPIYDATRQVSYLRDSLVLFNPGDIVKFRSIDRDEFDDIKSSVEAGSYDLILQPVTFALDDFKADPSATSAKLVEALYVR